METQIIVTKHAIEEYLNDNPKEKYPKQKLQSLYCYFKTRLRHKQARWYHDYVRDASVIKSGYEVIVFKDDIIITYYRTIPLRAVKLINKIQNKLSNIISGKLEIDKRSKEIKKFQRQQKKLNKYTSKNNTYKYNSQLSRCFNTR